MRSTSGTFAEKRKGSPPIVDLGLSSFSAHEQAYPVPVEALSKKSDAPIFLPAHLDLLSQTSPVPAADPDVSLYLHGPDRQPDAVSVIWRADLDIDAEDADVRRLMALVPPRSVEAVELPVWAVRRWLVDGRVDDLADVASAGPDRDERQGAKRGRGVFLWKGDDDDSRWITQEEVRPGATLVAPAGHGGLDRFGWNPESNETVVDVGREAALAFGGRRFVVRVAPGLLGSDQLSVGLARIVAEQREARWSELRDALLELPLPENVRTDLAALDQARRQRVIFYTDLHGQDGQGRPRGVVFIALFGLVGGSFTDDLQPSSTEDDTVGSLPGYSLPLEIHSRDVEEYAERFARAAGLPETHVGDLKLAGYLHDQGKRDHRFQAWLQYGDPLGPDPANVLAKSARRLPRKARAASGLPERWRHEALSVRLARSNERLALANDPMLVLWLVGTHHGFGRPFFPHCDPLEPPDQVGPQSLAFEWRGLDWASMFERLKTRYGVWALARMEAIVRLADHRASERRAEEEGTK